VSLRRLIERRQRLIPGGVPKYIRCYDNSGESADRYTCVYTGRYAGKLPGWCQYVAMNAMPFHPTYGIGMHGEHDRMIDVNDAGFAPAIGGKCHLGRRIAFKDLPEDCQALVVSDYCELWDLELPAPPPGMTVTEYLEQYHAEMRSYARQEPCRAV
jgi:hypothetical protein